MAKAKYSELNDGAVGEQSPDADAVDAVSSEAMQNRPNYDDPETARQHAAWKAAQVRVGDKYVDEHEFCPVCDYVMIRPGADPTISKVCGWDSRHTE
jgi:hypothetical protein